MSALLYLCFFLSGAAGLLYEIYWTQRFSLLLGMDVYSQAAVLTAFMGGLAIGSQMAGRWADKARRPWAAYARLELAIGVCGVAIPLILPLATGPLRAIYATSGQNPLTMTLARFAVAVIILALPTALMGATLPVMALGLRRAGDRLGAVVGRLYAVNTAGAVLGVLLGGFVLSEAIGLNLTNLTAVSLNVLAAVIALAADRSAPHSVVSEATEITRRRPAARHADANADQHGTAQKTKSAGAALPADPNPAMPLNRQAALIGLAAGLTGAAAMLTQLGWTRVLSLCIGSSTYAFSLIVAVFLIGLTLGSMIAAKLVRRSSDAAVPWAITCIATAALIWAVMIPLGTAPVRTEFLLREMLHSRNWPLPIVYAALGSLAFLLLAAPTIALGAVFPLACDAFAQRRSRGTARDTGSIYAMNTLGAMLGASLGGLVAIGALGIQGTLHAAAIGYALAALIAALVAAPVDRRRFQISLVVLGVTTAVVAYVLAVPWDPFTLNAAPYLVRPARPFYELLSYRESPDANIAVTRTPATGNIALLVNGKPDASNGDDMPTQIMIGQLPMLLHPRPQDVAVIGLGSGVTVHAVLTHEVARVDLIELSQAVIDAICPPSGPGPFDAVNGRPLDDPRVRVIVGDGRNHLALTDRKYDVIVSEPTNPWIAGVSSLFTREFFLSCRERLNRDGILCQWLQAYSLPAVEFCRILRTIDEVFPSASLWRSPDASDFMIIASDRAQPVVGVLEARLAQTAIRSELGPLNLIHPSDVLGLYVFQIADLHGLNVGAEVGPFDALVTNTDNLNLLRFGAVRGLWKAGSEEPYLFLSLQRRVPFDFLPPAGRASNPAELIARIEDVQDSHHLMYLYENSEHEPLRAAALMLGIETHRLRRSLQQAKLLPPPAPPPPRFAADMLAEARVLFGQSAAASDPEVVIDRARLARLSVLAALAAVEQADRANRPSIAATSQEHRAVDGPISREAAQLLVLLAEAELRMGRPSAAQSTLKRAIDGGAVVNEEVRARIGLMPP